MRISRLRDIIVVTCFLMLLLLIAMKLERDNTELFDGTFRAQDGDSLVLGDKRLRLSGIDAPELAQTCLRRGIAWNCGRQAQAALARLVAGGGANCQGNERDKYGRKLVRCYRDDLDINGEMVRMGMAVAFGDYEQEEAEAQSGGSGIWSAEFIRPAEWRKTHQPAGDRETPHVSSFLGALFAFE
ncbi:thermonuclease family protein [Rhizobium sp. KVB221]|uniref:Thermonuclease family protein n=1 Tax=Rhizobium setariae TaxID=2801340 RepID=A0A936YWP0_9HYPH|nr:thermonuclease family protein [Rhizobium setariae]MBL0374865.1 thermonuclease family protein [Rhizobium setariae]